MTTPIEVLCKGLPRTQIYIIKKIITLKVEFTTYLTYCHSIRFEDKPDYSFLRKMFKELYIKENYEVDYQFDWCLPQGVHRIIF